MSKKKAKKVVKKKNTAPVNQKVNNSNNKNNNSVELDLESSKLKKDFIEEFAEDTNKNSGLIDDFVLADEELEAAEETEAVEKAVKKTNTDGSIEEIVIKKASLKKKGISRKRLASKKAIKASWRRFGIGLAIYAGILVVLCVIFQIYTHGSLVKYEKSQSVYAMQEYFDGFNEKIAVGQLPEGMQLPEGVTQAEFIESLKGKKLSFEKAKDSYSSERPEYVILADEKEVVRVKYEGYNEEVIFAILTVLDWKVVDSSVISDKKGDDPAVKPTEPDNPTDPTKPSETETTPEETTTVPTHEYTIRVPSPFTVYVDDEALTYDDVAELTDEIDEMLYVNPYLLTAKMAYYKVEVPEGAVIRITDQFDNDVEYNADGYNLSADMTVLHDGYSQAYADTALLIAQTWSLFMTRDLTGENYGFGQIAQYLLPNSDYYNRAWRWATGEDITFTSPHTLGDPMFRDVVIDDLIVYSERCFSIHIAFKKDMYLTVTGGTALDETNSRFVFMCIDDTDDGEDNPRWVLADMIEQ